jgi:hypothetical protein
VREAGAAKPAPHVQVLKLSRQEYQSVVDATQARTLNAQEHSHLQVLLDTTFALQQAMEAKLSGGPAEALTRLQKMIFGTSSEKRSVVLAGKSSANTSDRLRIRS